MTYDDYNAFCGSLPATTHVVQWGGSHVWKVGGKVFAIGGWDGGGEPHVTFRVSDIAYEMLQERPGLSDDDLRAYLKESHRIVSLGLTRKLQKELGLNQP